MQQHLDNPRLRIELEGYQFASEAEADATYLVLAWFAVSESAALGIFPLLPALQMSQKHDPSFLKQFFEPGFKHFRDEQRHANLWCRALLDFSGRYPEVIRRVKLPSWLLKVMLRSVGKPHSIRNFAVDCLAFETVLRAFYEVAQPRLSYPPLQPIFATIIRDEEEHTAFGHDYIFKLAGSLSRLDRALIAFRYWRNLAGVVMTVQPMLAALDRHQPLSFDEFLARLVPYVKETGIAGSRRLVPGLLTRRK